MLYHLRQVLKDAALNVRCLIKKHVSIGVVALPLDLRVSASIRREILRGGYEAHEFDIVRRTLSPDDRVLEFGTGLGLLATYCSLEIGSDRVKTFEANPFMLPLICKSFALNGVSPKCVIGAIGPKFGQIDFHVRGNFWASSSHEGRSEGSAQTITVPMCALQDEIMVSKPTYLFIDIEGAETSLVGSSELPGVVKIMIEVHPELIGEKGVGRVLGWLSDLGFSKHDDFSKDNEIYLERR
jgi:FkbM family methyltransferase